LLIPESHNYPGFKGIAGPKLLDILRKQASQFGVAWKRGEVTELRREGNGSFTAQCDGAEIFARFVILATGLVDQAPSVDRTSDAAPDAIRYCPICDGYEAKDKRIGVIGALVPAAKKGMFLRTYSADVTVFATDGNDIERDKLNFRDIRVLEAPVRIRAHHAGVVASMPDGTEHKLDVLYPAMGCTVRSELATSLGAARCDEGTLKVDDHQRTTISGLYAAGDVVTDLHQLTVAIGHAAIAAANIHKLLPENPRVHGGDLDCSEIGDRKAPAGTKSRVNACHSMNPNRRLDYELDRLIPHLPAWGARGLRWVRTPAAVWTRVPIAIALILAGFLGFLPILGFWMVPLGLALIAIDVPFLRGPLAAGLGMVNRKLEARASAAGKPSSRPARGQSR
jgi:thioredoxin reductase (NADPH)